MRTGMSEEAKFRQRRIVGQKRLDHMRSPCYCSG